MDVNNDGKVNAQDVKFILKSKLFWLGVLQIGGAVIEFVTKQPAGTSYGMFASGILTIIFRYLTTGSVTLVPGKEVRKK